MSFILDALRKSEHERERKQLPGLADAPVARPEPSKLPWILGGVGALLAVNLVVLAVLLLRDDGPAPPRETPAVSATPAVQAGPAHGSAAPDGAPAEAALVVPTVPREVRPLAAEADAATAESDYDYAEPPPVDGARNVARVAPGEPSLAAPRPAAPALPPVPGDGRVGLATPPRTTLPPRAASVPGIPRIDDLAPQATAGLPPLYLNLHVYSNDPAQRFVVLNGERYREGTRLAAGPALERITPEGVVLNHDGLRFLLPRD